MLIYWFQAARPKTLSIAVIPVLVGSCLAWLECGCVSWGVLAAALAGALLIQTGTNLHNDAADFARGADDPATRLGPTRVTARGLLTPRQVHLGAAVSFILAAVAGGYLVWVGGLPVLVIGVFSILAGLAYTGGPFPIAYGPLGEFFVWLFFGLIAVSTTFYLHTGMLNGTAILAGCLLGLPAAAVLVVNNYRDLDNDRKVGKRTLAVRAGRSVSRWEYALLMVLPYGALVPLAWLLGNPWAGLAPVLSFPWALRLVNRLWREPPGPVFNWILASTARLQLVFGLLLCGGLLAPGVSGWFV